MIYNGLSNTTTHLNRDTKSVMRSPYRLLDFPSIAFSQQDVTEDYAVNGTRVGILMTREGKKCIITASSSKVTVCCRLVSPQCHAHLGPLQNAVQTEIVFTVLRSSYWLLNEGIEADGTFLSIFI